ncbi:tRNA (guanine(46)-N(7))-methyltransferase TrmB [Pirellulaceae bacterium SH449]
MKSKRFENNSDPTQLQPGEIEYEMGIPIPGEILEKDRWVQTAWKKLPESGHVDLETLFGRTAPLAVELGCGNARFTISSAVRRPDWNHIALDILPAVIRYATRRGNQRGLANTRFAVSDGWRFLSTILPPESAREIHIYHPQPFADPEQSSRRMLTPDFLLLLYQALTDDGEVFLQSDRLAYWNYIRQTMSALFEWIDIEQPWAEDPHGRSRREMLSGDQGLSIYRGIARRRPELTLELAEQIAATLPQPDFAIESHDSARSKRRAPTRQRRSRYPKRRKG